MIKNRTIFIWDVQWCYNELKLLIKKLNLTPEDKVFFTWDLINKWPKSFKVLRYVYKNKDQFKCVKWNNEIDFLERLEWKSYKINKKFKKIKDKIKQEWTPHLIQYIKDLPLYIENDNFILIHWWLIPNKSIIEHSPDEITRLCEYKWIPWYRYYEWEKVVIYWHWAKEGVQIREKTKWIDSGCVYWKALTAYILETNEVIQQTALDLYINPYKTEKTIFDSIKNIFNFKKWN